MKNLLLLCTLAVVCLLARAAAAVMPSDCTQAVVGMADGWNSSNVTLYMVEKGKNGQWVRVFGPVPARLGRSGLVWGWGLHPVPAGATTKREGDWRSPAGVFEIGGLWTTTQTPVQHDSRIREIRVGPNDLWVSDINTPKLYNRHVRLKHPAASAWELKEQMRQTDYAHSIKLLIHHNTENVRGCPKVGAGSSIFFHIWRQNGGSPTAGCTAMAEANLRALISRLNPRRHPVYILLPKAEYMKLRPQWQLP